MATTYLYRRESAFDRSTTERWTVKAGAGPATLVVGLLDGTFKTVGGSTPNQRPRNIRAVSVHYGAAQAGGQTIPVVLNTGDSDNFIIGYANVPAGGSDGVYIPEETMRLLSDDTLTVTAPDGGTTISLAAYSDVDESI